MSQVENSPEVTDGLNPGAAGPDVVAQLTAERDAARKKVDELARGLLASERDREEFKVRMTRERERMMDAERGSVAVLVIEAIDELDRCLQSADASPLAQGVKLIRDGLLKKVIATGIERLDLVGQRFDPNLAEATDMEITTDKAEDGKILAVSNACYVLKERVIRAGKVKVARYVEPAQG